MDTRPLRLRAVAAAVVAVGVLGLGAWRSEQPRLKRLVCGRAGPPTLVLLHGYSSSAAEWKQFVGNSSAARRLFMSDSSFPQGPEILPGHPGEARGHAWWRMDLASFVPVGQSLPDLAEAEPPGLDHAAIEVEELLGSLTRDRAKDLPVLGGFSQGAMVAAQVAFTSSQPLAALVLLSVTPVDEAAWRRGFASRRDLPIFMAHGRDDRSLSFAAADRLRTEMQHAGMSVTWYPFAGGHEIPAEVTAALNQFLASKGLIPRTSVAAPDHPSGSSAQK